MCLYGWPAGRQNKPVRHGFVYRERDRFTSPSSWSPPPLTTRELNEICCHLEAALQFADKQAVYFLITPPAIFSNNLMISYLGVVHKLQRLNAFLSCVCLAQVLWSLYSLVWTTHTTSRPAGCSYVTFNKMLCVIAT